MDKEHRVSVYDMVKELNLKEVTPEINSREVYIEQAEINRPALQLAGFFENFAKNRVQIIGKAEHLFIVTYFFFTWKREKIHKLPGLRFDSYLEHLKVPQSLLS